MMSSKNYKVLRDILSKSRTVNTSSEITYLVIYSFLYKYCSDLLKDYFLMVTREKEITLSEAYSDEFMSHDLERDAINMFGYHIINPDAFIDEVINEHYSDRFFIYPFFNSFSENIIFDEGSNYEKYFRFIFDAIKSQININKFEYEGENHLIVKDIVYSISRLDVFEEEFPYEKVFDRVCQSRLIDIDDDPDYITQLLTVLALATKDEIQDVYSPFLNDASSLIRLIGNYNFTGGKVYAKGQDLTSYCCSLIKLYMHNFDLDSVFAEFGSQFELIQSNAQFDVIVSRIPPFSSRRVRKLNKHQAVELEKQNRMKEIQSLLSSEMNVNEDSLMEDRSVKMALEKLVDKLEFEDASRPKFYGEYASLEKSEYLFLINLINRLKRDGVMIVSLAQSFLFKNTLQTLRKYLTVEMNCIDCVISLPDDISRKSRSEIIIVFKINRNRDDIVFIDMSKNYATQKSSHLVPGLFRRNLVFDDKTLNEIVNVYRKHMPVDKFSNVVRIDEIVKNDFNMSISRYVDTFEGEFVHLRDLEHEKEKIDIELDDLTQKIDKMMRDLNLKVR